ncbi:MAG: amidohydrolase family protein [Alphaproteobacteria bacterium]|nr:amidohydrolase family protein [Alphaproteobacteria bacterium]
MFKKMKRAAAMMAALIMIEGQVIMAGAEDKTHVDMIAHGRYVVTMDDARGVVEFGAVAVKDGAIVAVGTAAEITATYSADDILAGENRVLMPGMVNGHTHSAMVLFRGMADDLDLMTWLTKYIFPMEGRYVDPDFIAVGSELACWEMIRGGTTSFVDMYFYPDVIAGVVDKCGLRAVITAPMIDFPSPGFKGWEDSYAAGVKFVEDWQGKHPRITPGLAPHAPYTVSKEHLSQVAAKAKELGAPISIHIAEDQAEVKKIAAEQGMTSIELMAETGLLDVTTVAAHVVWPTDSDMKALAGAPVGAIHNPTSNLKTAAGIAPIPQMLEAGVKVGLGTDGAASNNDLDMWEEMRLAALLNKGKQNDPTVVPASAALKMATSGGAEAVGLGDVTGALKPGMKADMIQVSLDSLRLAPLYDVMSHLVYAAGSHDVVTTVVEGKVLMRDGKMLTIDEDALRARVEAVAEKIRADLAKTE